MAQRKRLKNLACGMAGRFASRNNDLDGYWALGLLFLAAEAAETKSVSLDLLSKSATPPVKYSERLIVQFAQYMNQQLETLHLAGHVFVARIEIEFSVEALPHSMTCKNTWGDPFIVLAMGLKPSPSGETFRFLYCRDGKLPP